MNIKTTTKRKIRHTCLFSSVHWFIAKCIFSVPKPTLPIKGFVNICAVNCSPCLQEEKILLGKSPYTNDSIWYVIYLGALSFIDEKNNKNLQEGDLVTGTVTAINSITPTTSRKKITGKLSLKFTEHFTTFFSLTVNLLNLGRYPSFLMKKKSSCDECILLSLLIDWRKNLLRLSLAFIRTHDKEFHNRVSTELTSKEFHGSTCIDCVQFRYVNWISFQYTHIHTYTHKQYWLPVNFRYRRRRRSNEYLAKEIRVSVSAGGMERWRNFGRSRETK